jgi:hypothetical protein
MVFKKKVVPEAVSTEWTLSAIHPYDRYTGTEYFYDGELPVVDGVVKVPKNRPDWARKLIMDCYELLGEEMPEEILNV